MRDEKHFNAKSKRNRDITLNNTGLGESRL
jgi:hypothetical protein